MELKDQVISLDSARRLKELGVKQESLFYWYRWTDTFNRHFGELPDEKDNNTLGAPSIQPVPLSGITDRFSAFTVAELGQLLPKSFTNIRGLSYPEHVRNKRDGVEQFYEEEVEWFLETRNAGLEVCYVWYLHEAIEWLTIKGETEAEARAKMLIYLLENKLI